MELGLDVWPQSLSPSHLPGPGQESFRKNQHIMLGSSSWGVLTGHLVYAALFLALLVLCGDFCMRGDSLTEFCFLSPLLFSSPCASVSHAPISFSPLSSSSHFPALLAFSHPSKVAIRVKDLHHPCFIQELCILTRLRFLLSIPKFFQIPWTILNLGRTMLFCLLYPPLRKTM